MKYLSLFSGIGGFELGIQQAYENLRPIQQDISERPKEQHNDKNKLGEWKCVGYSEIDKYAIQIYKKHFPKHKNYGDCTKINPAELPDFDLLCGGFPCQAFSIAGKRLGFNDTRGTLFFDIARIAKEKRPKYLLLENVKGLLSHDNGRTFKTIITTLTELGYDLEWQVLNSKNFGVPQNRERVFIVGYLGGECRQTVFPIGETSKNAHKRKKLPKQFTNTLRTNYSNAHSNETYVAEKLDYVGAVMSEKNKQWLENGKELSRNFPQGQRVYSTKGIASNICGDAGGLGGKTGLYETGTQIRRLTPTECERLQGFPDGWTEYGLSDIMEICVNINNVKEKQLLELDIALNTTKDGKGMVLPICQNGKKSDVNIVLDSQLLEVGVKNTINLGKDMVMLFNQNEILRNEEQIKKNLMLEKMGEKSIYRLWKIRLADHYEKEKLSTILTWIKRTMNQLTSTYAKTEKNIIGVIIHLSKLEQSFLKGKSLNFRKANIESISDTQRYKCLGNAVTVNVIKAIISTL